MSKKDKPLRVTYSEPTDFFPKELRKEFNLGEFSKKGNKSSSKPTKKK